MWVCVSETSHEVELMNVLIYHKVLPLFTVAECKEFVIGEYKFASINYRISEGKVWIIIVDFFIRSRYLESARQILGETKQRLLDHVTLTKIVGTSDLECTFPHLNSLSLFNALYISSNNFVALNVAGSSGSFS